MYHYTVTYEGREVARASSDRIDVAMSQGNASVPAGYLLTELEYEMLDAHGGVITGPVVAPVRFN